MIVRTLLCAAVVVSASTAWPQSALAPLTASVEVKVINVDVTVTDGSGKAVSDLTKDDQLKREDDNVRQCLRYAKERLDA